MTLSTVGFGRSFPRVWIVPIGLMTVILGLGVFGVLSRSIVADLLAWWPIWLGLALAAVLLRHRMFGKVRAAGIVPLVATLSVLFFAWGHVAGWSLMPSASQRLVGPEVGSTVEASLTAEIDGVLDIKSGATFLYVVEPASGGGRFGIPESMEESLDSTVTVTLEERPDPGLYTSAGWDIILAPGPLWTVNVDGAVNADLRGLGLAGLSAGGAGSLTLGVAIDEVAINVSGQFDVVLPASTPATLSGVASVPDSWTLTDGGATSPAGEDGWRIVVAPGSSVRVIEG